jgi:NAD-dependent dihydropyrimidine dehydrogenase PreA subunit/bacterioferritin-associated ferredoxin
VRLVNYEIEIIDDNCTGCYRCERACPTEAISMVGPKQSALAVVNNDRCIACFRCIDSCDDDAMLARAREEPVLIETALDSVDGSAIAALCREAGLDPELSVCFCSQTQAKEVAASILSGAQTFSDLALSTGVQSGCLLYCSVPMRRMLVAHLGRQPDESASKMRRVPAVQSVLDLPADLAERYPIFCIAHEQAVASARLAGLDVEDI